MSSLRQLAVQLNLSHATVSAALRGSPGVKPETRRRILQVAKESGYQANPLASALMAEMRRSRGGTFRGLIAILRLQGNEAPSPAVAARHRTIALAADRRANELGFKTDEITVGRDAGEFDRLPTILEARGITGILILPTTRSLHLKRLAEGKISAVYADVPDDELRLDSVSPDYHQSMLIALHRLRDLGYGRPGLLLDAGMPEPARTRWVAAYHSFFLNAPDSFFPRAFVFDHETSGAFKNWMRQGAFDVILASDPALVRFFPKDPATRSSPCGFCSLDASSGPKAYAGVDPQFEAVGRRAMDVLCKRAMRHEHADTENSARIMIPATWREGSTLVTEQVHLSA